MYALGAEFEPVSRSRRAGSVNQNGLSTGTSIHPEVIPRNDYSPSLKTQSPIIAFKMTNVLYFLQHTTHTSGRNQQQKTDT